MTIARALTWSTQRLARGTSPALDAELLLAHSLGVDRSHVLTHTAHRLPTSVALRFWLLVWRRHQGVPIAYLTGTKEFYGRNFRVNRQVLIPRPETEVLVEHALGTIRANGALATAVDIGTGSGCIAITLACELPQLKVIATDISQPALKLARQNATAHQVAQRITFLHGDLLKPLRLAKHEWRNTILIANLPYLQPNEVQGDLRHEPRGTLVGGNDGLRYYRELMQQLSTLPRDLRLYTILLELHPPTAQAVEQIARNFFPHATLNIDQDLARRPRVLTLTLA